MASAGGLEGLEAVGSGADSIRVFTGLYGRSLLRRYKKKGPLLFGPLLYDEDPKP